MFLHVFVVFKSRHCESYGRDARGHSFSLGALCIHFLLHHTRKPYWSRGIRCIPVRRRICEGSCILLVEFDFGVQCSSEQRQCDAEEIGEIDLEVEDHDC